MEFTLSFFKSLKLKNFLFFIFAFIFFFSLFFQSVSAVEVSMDSSYNKGETLIARISGNFKEPLSSENIDLYKIRSGDWLLDKPKDVFLSKIGDYYWVSLNLPDDVEEKTNYSLVLEDIDYVGNEGKEKIFNNFSLSNESADFSISPGTIITKDSFNIDVKNLKSGELSLELGVNDSVYFSDEESDEIDFFSSAVSGKETKLSRINDGVEFNIPSYGEEEIYFELENVSSESLKNLRFSSPETSYNVPVYIYSSQDNASDSEEETQGDNESMPDLRFSRDNISVLMKSDDKTLKSLSIKNHGDLAAESLVLNVPDELREHIHFGDEKYTKEWDKLNGGSEVGLNLRINSSSEDKFVEGNISLSYESFDKKNEIFLPVSLNFSSGSEYDFNDSENGEDDVYTPNITDDSDQEDEDTEGTGFYIGVGIIVLVVGFLVWFYFKKYKKAGNKKPGLSKVFSKKQDKK